MFNLKGVLKGNAEDNEFEQNVDQNEDTEDNNTQQNVRVCNSKNQCELISPFSGIHNTIG